MDDVEQAWDLRRKLGRDLKAQRQAAGLTQPQLARRTGYSRSTIATLESMNGGAVARGFWERCDTIFGTGQKYAHRWDDIHQHVQTARTLSAAARRRPGPRRSASAGTADLQALRALRTADPGPEGVAQARTACAQLGWPITPGPAPPELVTGTVLDALEVPRAAGMLAIQWWLETGGAADPIRQLPTMPRPDHALAAIAVGCSVYFLTRAGVSLWPPDGPLRQMPGLIEEPPAGVTRTAGPVVLWHSSGSRIPLPPGPGSDGEPAYWTELPSRRVVLSLPVALLDLLAKAVSATQDTMMAIRLPGGVLAIPAGK
jgi:hypothetical protein